MAIPLARLTLVGLIVVITAVSADAHVMAADTSPPMLPNGEQTYNYFSLNQDINDAIYFFAFNLGIAADIAPGIKGRTGVKMPRDLSRLDYLNYLASEFRFVWYFDGSRLHAVPSSSVQTEVFALENNDGMRIMAVLSRLGLYQPKFQHHYDMKGRVFMVSGPPAYVSDIKKTVEALEKANKANITVLRGSVVDSTLSSLSRTPVGSQRSTEFSPALK